MSLDLFRSQLVVAALALLAAACICPFSYTSLPDESATSDEVGTLDVTINYDDDFYVETFGYSRDAKNVRHFVLVIPESEPREGDPGWIFTSIELQPDGSLSVREDRQEYAWALDYVYDAPRGYFTQEFEPGRYQVAAAFITGPVSREEAEVEDDVVLWAGVTGGGANTDSETVELEAGKTISLTFDMTDANGWACPWVYVFDGQDFTRYSEILRNVRGAENEQTETTTLSIVHVLDGYIVLRVTEEKDEVSYIDLLALDVGGEIVTAQGNDALLADDGDYLVLSEGESVDVRFPVPESYLEGAPVRIIADGYYVLGE